MKEKESCAICQKEYRISELVSADWISDYIAKLIQEKNPDWTEKSLICKTDLNRFRSMYVREAIQQDMGEISQLEEEVVQSIKEHELIADNINEQYDENLSFGDRMADRIAIFGGSWKFIGLFATILLTWIIVNAVFLLRRPFDPYPFILLNLVLSCLSAIQAPFIMMSQNRQATKDRLRAELDYQVNLKAELEIRHLKAKLDQLASQQWRRLLEIQELQTELMEDLSHATKKNL